MRVIPALVLKSKVNFGESDEPVEYTPKYKKWEQINDTFHLKRNTIMNDYNNGIISTYKFKRLINRVIKQEQKCKKCLELHFDENLKVIAKEFKTKDNFFVKFFRALKAI